jgi:hypothetical protein
MAPVNAPSNWAVINGIALDQSPEATAKPIVTAGFKCAAVPPQAIAVKTPAMTANAQPAVITIQPAPFEAWQIVEGYPQSRRAVSKSETLP